MSYTQESLYKLLNLANMFVKMFHPDSDLEQVKYFIRAKPQSYFLTIINSNNGIMPKYPKDLGNDPLNPLNNRVSGLFFLPDFNITTSEYFGNTLLCVPISYFQKSPMELYFADFYCLKSLHYVTLVLCKSFSSASNFCDKHLIKLNKNSNPYLTFGLEVKALHKSDLIIEIFYIDDINLIDVLKIGGYITTNKFTRGHGESKPFGKKKNRFCPYCNLKMEAITAKVIKDEIPETTLFKETYPKKFEFSSTTNAKYCYNEKYDGKNEFFLRETFSGF